MAKLPYQITLDDALDVWIRHWSGEYQHHIAASYGVNPGRVNDVIKGRKHPESEGIAKMRKEVA
jgi:hypothetical protein